MRCLTVAEAVKNVRSATVLPVGTKTGTVDGTEAGAADVLFLCADEDSAALARRYGFETGVLNTDYRLMETEVKPEAICAWDLWIKGQDHTILVDSYYVTEDYLRDLKRYGRVFLIDDLQTKSYPVDGVINYNVFADKRIYEQLYETNPAVRLILGGEYVPLRTQFQGLEYEVKERVKDVLITTGGGDADNIAGQILNEIYDPKICFHVLSGRFNPHFEELKERADSTDNIRIHHDVTDMAGLMQGCDLAVSAGGSTMYELCAAGVPFVCFSYAENQEALVEYIGANEIAKSAGAWHKDDRACREEIGRQFGELCADTALRQRISAIERKLIDGRGAERLAWILARKE